MPPRRRAALLSLTSALVLLASASPAGAATFQSAGAGPHEASAHNLLAPGGGGFATVPYRITTGDDETASVVTCLNSDFETDPDDGSLTCPSLGSNSETVGENSTTTVDVLVKAGRHSVAGISSAGGSVSVTQLEVIEVLDECLWQVRSAFGLKDQEGILARAGDWFPCASFFAFEPGSLAPPKLDLESAVDRSRFVFRGPGSFATAPGRVGASGDLALQTTQRENGVMELSTPRRLSRQWTLTTEAAVINVLKGKPAKLRATTTRGGVKTTVKNLGKATITVSTFGHGGATSIPPSQQSRRQCIQLRKYTVVLGRGQSTTVLKGRPPSGGPAAARRSCRR